MSVNGISSRYSASAQIVNATRDARRAKNAEAAKSAETAQTAETAASAESAKSTGTSAATAKEAATAVAKETASAVRETATAAVKEDGAAAVFKKGASVKYSDLSDTERATLAKQLEADTAARKESMMNLVKQMLGQQTTSYAQASVGSSENDIWQFLAKGDFEVDAETQAEAQKAISEDGYWGVEQTSDRIIKYAQTLAGDDPEKLETMIDAVKKGFKEAEKAWGGKLPSITDQTYSAVMDKFDKLKEQYGIAAATA